MDKFELTYDKVLNTVFSAANPIKKKIISTQCKVHKYLNIRALDILKNDKYIMQYNFFRSFIYDINEGAVWADQDFRSSNHFFNPFKSKGLYGRRTAMDLGIEYYNSSIKHWNRGDYHKSLFYLGAALHIIQDMTIPQHANIRLLDNHRQYETYVLSTYDYIKEFKVDKGSYFLESIEDYIRFNSRVALKIYNKFKHLSKDEERFFKIARCGLPLAMRTTAGAMILFHNEINDHPKDEK